MMSTANKVKVIDGFCEVFKRTIREVFPELDPHTTLGGDEDCFAGPIVTNASVVCNKPLPLRVRRDREDGGGYYLFALSPKVDVEIEEEMVKVSSRWEVASYTFTTFQTFAPGPGGAYGQQGTDTHISVRGDDMMFCVAPDGETFQSIPGPPRKVFAELGPKMRTAFAEVISPKADTFSVDDPDKACEKLRGYMQDLRKLKAKEKILMAFSKKPTQE